MPSQAPIQLQVMSLTGQEVFAQYDVPLGAAVALPPMPAALYLVAIQSGQEIVYRQLLVR